MFSWNDTKKQETTKENKLARCVLREGPGVPKPSLWSPGSSYIFSTAPELTEQGDHPLPVQRAQTRRCVPRPTQDDWAPTGPFPTAWPVPNTHLGRRGN